MGAAKLDLAPEMANALAVSTDLVRVRGVPDTRRDQGILVGIEYPHSTQNYETRCARSLTKENSSWSTHGSRNSSR